MDSAQAYGYMLYFVSLMTMGGIYAICAWASTFNGGLLASLTRVSLDSLLSAPMSRPF